MADTVYLVMCDGYNHTQENYTYVVSVHRVKQTAYSKCAELKAKEDGRAVHNRKYDYNTYTVHEFEVN